MFHRWRDCRKSPLSCQELLPYGMTRLPMYKNTFSRDPDLNRCWDVHIDQITSYPGATGTEHNTIGIEQAPNDNRFSGFVSNLPLTEDGGNFLGIVVKKDV